MRYILSICMIGSLCMVSCNNSAKKEETGTQATSNDPTSFQSRLDEAGTQKLLEVMNHYYELKDALVAADAGKADEGATKLVTSANSLDAYIKTDSINRTAILPYLDTIRDGSSNILAVMDETTEKKRISFEQVSDAMYNLLKAAEVKNAHVYRQYCPMAFNDKGAHWLSNSTEIRNPYFGEKMLECGEVTDSL
jgi:hypothetical protein